MRLSGERVALTGIKLIIASLLSQQLFVISSLHDPALFEDKDHITVLDRRQSVSNDESRSAGHQLVHAVLDDLLCSCIDGTGRFVEDQNRRVCDRGPGDRKELPLSLRQVGAVALQHGVISLRQSFDETVRVGELGSRDDFFLCGVQFAVPDILFYRTGEQMCVLKDNAEGASEIGLFDLVDVDIVVTDLSVLNIVKAVDQGRALRE